MRPVVIALAAMLLVSAAGVQAKPAECGPIRDRIEAQAKAKGLKTARVEVVAVGDLKKEDESLVVGRCEAGSKRLLLHRKG